MGEISGAGHHQRRSAPRGGKARRQVMMAAFPQFDAVGLIARVLDCWSLFADDSNPKEGGALSGSQLMIKPMPPSAVISGFVKGVPDCNYELYLRELVNSSAHFLDKGKSTYREPPSEEDGQCDAIAEEYELDFKLLDSKTRLMADSILKMRPVVLAPGVTALVGCRNPDGKVVSTNLRAALRRVSVEDLIGMRNAKTNRDAFETDIPQVLKVFEVKKNVLALYPYIFSFGQQGCTGDPTELIRVVINDCFASLFLYREKVNPGYDSYLTTVFSDSFLIFRFAHGEFSLTDSVSTENAPTYKRLIRYSEIWR